MTKEALLYQFWNSFGIPGYEENTVPEDATFPYITYQVITDSLNSDVQQAVSVWYRGTSWIDVNRKTDEISRAIGTGGIILDGKIWIKRGTSFAHNMGDADDDLIKRKYLNLSVEYFTED